MGYLVKLVVLCVMLLPCTYILTSGRAAPWARIAWSVASLVVGPLAFYLLVSSSRAICDGKANYHDMIDCDYTAALGAVAAACIFPWVAYGVFVSTCKKPG
jgi:hypothetical protein